MDNEPVTVNNYQQIDLTHMQIKLLKKARKQLLECDPPVSNNIRILAHYGLLDCTNDNLDYLRKNNSKIRASFIITDIGIMYLQYRYHKYLLAYIPIVLSFISVIVSMISLCLKF